MEYDSLARAIQSFHQAEVERYEHELKKFRETAGRLEASRKQREAQLRDFFVASNLSVDQLKKGEEESQEYLTQFLTEVRPALANQEPKGAQPSLDRARIIDAHAPNGRTLNVAAATLLAPEASFLDGNPGEQGNPWVLPWNPGRVHISQSSRGDGSGCGAHGIQPPSEAIFWYVFTPDRRAIWNLWPFTSLDGFYLMRADDGFFTCKYADVEVNIDMDVYQYFWHGAKQVILLDRHHDNIDVGERFDRSHYFDYRTSLAPGKFDNRRSDSDHRTSPAPGRAMPLYE